MPNHVNLHKALQGLECFLCFQRIFIQRMPLKTLKTHLFNMTYILTLQQIRKWTKKERKSIAQKKHQSFIKKNIKNTINKNHVFQNNMKHLAKKITQISIRNDSSISERLQQKLVTGTYFSSRLFQHFVKWTKHLQGKN